MMDNNFTNLFQIQTTHNYSGRKLIQATPFTLQHHLPEEKYEKSSVSQSTVAYSIQTYQILNEPVDDILQKYNSNADKSITLHEILEKEKHPTAINLVIDIDGTNHILDQEALDSAKRLYFGLKSLFINEGSDYVIHISGGGGFHFVFPYWTWSNFNEYTMYDVVKIAEYICAKFDILFDKNVYKSGQIIKGAFSYDFKAAERCSNMPKPKIFSYSISGQELAEWPLEKIIQTSKTPIYRLPADLISITQNSPALKSLVAEALQSTIAQNITKGNEVYKKENTNFILNEPSSIKNECNIGDGTVNFKCPVVNNIFMYGRDSLIKRWGGGGTSARWSEQLPIKTAIFHLQYQTGLDNYYSELKKIFNPERVEIWRSDPIEKYIPNCSFLHKMNFEMTGIDITCNFKCSLYKNFKKQNNDLIAANLPKSQRAVYNKWSREYFGQQKIYLFEQDLYQVSDNVARKMSPEEIAVIKNDFKVWLGDEYNDPKLIEKMMNNAVLNTNLFLNKNYMAFKDKLLNLENFEPEEYNDKVVFIQLPYNYNLCETGTNFDKYLEEALLYHTSGSAEELQKMNFLIDELLASAIAPEKFHKAFLFRGIPGTGKSVLLKIIRYLAGEENTGAVKLNQLSDDNYILGLQHKSLNVADEKAKSSKIEIDETKLKDCIDGTPQSLRRKYKENISLSLQCFFVFASNNKMNVNDRWSVSDRFIVIPFERVFRNEDCDNRNLAELIKEKDMPYILYRAIRGLKCLRKNEGKYTIPDFIKKATDGEFKQNSPVFEWAAEHLEWSIGDFTRAKGSYSPKTCGSYSGAYISYVQFCKCNGYKALGYTNFKEELEIEVMRKTIKSEHKSKGNGYRNIRLRHDVDDKKGPSITDMTYEEYIKSKNIKRNIKSDKQLEF